MTAVVRRIPVVLLAFLVANAVATLLITLCMFFEWEEVLRASGAHPVRLAAGVFGLIMSTKMLAAALLVLPNIFASVRP